MIEIASGFISSRMIIIRIVVIGHGIQFTDVCPLFISKFSQETCQSPWWSVALRLLLPLPVVMAQGSAIEALFVVSRYLYRCILQLVPSLGPLGSPVILLLVFGLFIGSLYDSSESL